MSTAQPGYWFSSQVPPTVAFFSRMVKGMPISFSRIAMPEAGDAGADDDHLEGLEGKALGVALPVHGARILRAKPGLLDQQGDVFLRHGLAHAAAHHALQRLGRRQGRRGPVKHGTVLQRLDQPVRHLLLEVRRHQFEEAPGAMDMRRDLIEDRQVAGELHQHHELRRDIGIVQRRPQCRLVAYRFAHLGLEFPGHPSLLPPLAGGLGRECSGCGASQ